jgi:hypothetical protein
VILLLVFPGVPVVSVFAKNLCLAKKKHKRFNFLPKIKETIKFQNLFFLAIKKNKKQNVNIK